MRGCTRLTREVVGHALHRRSWRGHYGCRCCARIVASARGWNKFPATCCSGGSSACPMQGTAWGHSTFSKSRDPWPANVFHAFQRCELSNSLFRRLVTGRKARPAGLCGLSAVNTISAWPQAPECYNSRLSGAPGATAAGGTTAGQCAFILLAMICFIPWLFALKVP